MYSTGNERNIEYHIKTICTINNDLKRMFVDEWRSIWIEQYLNINQYGLYHGNGQYGVLTPKGTWSPINQFNTNYTLNLKIVETLNKWIFNDFFLKGVSEIGGNPVKEITFKNDSPNFVVDEIKNYFHWVRHYKNKILIDQRLIGPSDFIYELFSITSKTIGIGTYGEICIEYYFKKKIKSAKIYRTSSSRGSITDMIGGCDLFTVNNDDNSKIKKIQSKVVKFFGDSFKSVVDVNGYLSKEIDFLVLVSLNYDFTNNTIRPDRMVFLYLKEDTIIDEGNGFYTYNKNNILMEEKIDDILNSKIFFEFFMYCSKNDIEFSLEVSEETNLEFLKEENKILVSLPTSSENFDMDKIYSTWVEIIQSISKKQEDIDFMMDTLKKLFKK